MGLWATSLLGGHREATMRNGSSYLREAKHLRALNESLDLEYALDREISELVHKRRKLLLAEIESNESPKLVLLG